MTYGSSFQPTRRSLAVTSAIILALTLGVTGCSRHEDRDTSPVSAADGNVTGNVVSPEQVHWAPYAEPTEHAFTVELPVGWPAQGGLKRLSSGEVRPWLRASAPDGSAEIFIGDPELPDFTPPTPGLASAGLTEGKTYMPGEGRALTLSPYHDGQTFSAEWGRGKIGAHCDQVTPAGGKSQPAAAEALAAALSGGAPQVSWTAGETRFNCGYRGRPANAWVFAATVLDSRGPFQIWDARTVGGFIAWPEHWGLAGTAFAHAARSFAADADWLKRQPGWSGDRLRASPKIFATMAGPAEESLR